MKKQIGVLLCLVAFVGVAQDRQYKELTVSGGEVNWTTGRVSAEGYGVAPDSANAKVGPLLACRAAVVDAQRNLLEATQGVRVTSTTVINNYMLSSDEVKSTVEGIIQDARILNRVPDSEGGCKIVMDIPLAGGASKAVYSQLAKDSDVSASQFWSDIWNQIVPTAYASTLDEQTEMTEAPWATRIDTISKRLSVVENALTAQQQSQSREQTSPTGLVVDARGSNFIPSLSPKIRQLRGSIVYPDGSVQASDKLLARGQLVSLFARDVDFAINHPVVGARPLLVKALRTYGDTRTEIVIDQSQSTKVKALNDTGFFEEAGGIIVLD